MGQMLSIPHCSKSPYPVNPGTADLLQPSSIRERQRFTFGVHDGYGGYVALTKTINGYHKTGRRVAENSAAGTAVGVPVTGTPYDDGDDQTDDALTYSLTGKAADSGLFVIDSATGQISVAENAVLDYETDDTHREIEYWPPDSKNVHSKFYRGEVRYTVNGHAARIEVLISLDDILPPGKTETPSLARKRSAKPANPALNVSWTALATADNRDPVARYEYSTARKPLKARIPPVGRPTPANCRCRRPAW